MNDLVIVIVTGFLINTFFFFSLIHMPRFISPVFHSLKIPLLYPHCIKLDGSWVCSSDCWMY